MIFLNIVSWLKKPKKRNPFKKRKKPLFKKPKPKPVKKPKPKRSNVFY